MKQVYLTRITAFLLVVLMLTGVAGCKKSKVSYVSEYYYEDDSTVQGTTADGGDETEIDGNNASTNSNSGNANSTASTTTGQQKKVDVRGYTFTLVSGALPSEVSSTSTGFEKNLFNRIKEVEKEYGCKIQIVNSYDTTPDNLQPLILAGKKVGDAVEVIATRVLPLAKSNYIIPWNSIDGINVNDSKYIQGYTPMATFDGNVYGLQFMKPAEVRMCVVFNKSNLKSAKIDADSLYTAATNKKWNFDMLQDYAKKTTVVVNNTTSVWGLGGTPIDVVKSFIRANNGRLVNYANGKASAAYTSQNVIDAIDYFNKLVNDDKVYMTADGMEKSETFAKSTPDYNKAFIDGKLTFLIAESWVINQQIKGKVSFDYGMLPVPIGYSATDYIGNADNSRVWCMTSTNAKSADFEKSVFIFNKLSEPSEGYEGDDWWEYDVKQEYFQSASADKDIAMYKLCINTAAVDVGWGLVSMREDFCETAVYGPLFYHTTTPSAAISALNGVYDKTIDAMFNK